MHWYKPSRFQKKLAKSILFCPNCWTPLIPAGEDHYETLLEHVSHPNAQPSKKTLFVCPNENCMCNHQRGYDGSYPIRLGWLSTGEGPYGSYDRFNDGWKALKSVCYVGIVQPPYSFDWRLTRERDLENKFKFTVSIGRYTFDFYLYLPTYLKVKIYVDDFWKKTIFTPWFYFISFVHERHRKSRLDEALKINVNRKPRVE